MLGRYREEIPNYIWKGSGAAIKDSHIISVTEVIGVRFLTSWYPTFADHIAFNTYWVWKSEWWEYLETVGNIWLFWFR